MNSARVKRIKDFIRLSKREYSKYKKTGKDNYLAQAGEKLWNAFNMLMEEIVKRDIKKFAELKDAVLEVWRSGDGLVLSLFDYAYDLHKFFYRGWTEDISVEERQYLTVLDMLTILMKRYKIK